VFRTTASWKIKYGDKKAEVVTSVLSNHFFGNTKNPQTAERISRLYGKHDEQFVTESEGKSRGHSRGGVNVLGTHSRGRNFTKSTTIRERQRVKPQDIGNLDKGEFYISIVESGEHDLKVQFAGDERITEEIPAFRDVSNDQVKQNFHKIKSEAMSILEGDATGKDEISIEWK
jgi:type IV secretory pathway TraG/TraD family ATPase VirD4